MDSIDFIKQFPVRRFTKDSPIISEGDEVNQLFAIQTGYIKVSSLNSDGIQRLLWIAGRYDIAPTEQLFSKSTAVTFYYTALTDVTAYVISKDAFLTKAHDSPAFLYEIAVAMSGHYDDLLHRLNSLEQTSIRGRLIHTLHYLATRFSAENAVDLFTLDLRLTHQDIAEMIGATRETTSVELQKLRLDDLISYDRSSFIVHVDRLSELLAVS
jgi:CRP/FNR family transcriptional regulator